MKNKLKELEVDFIGEQNAPLTKEEEKSISDYITRVSKKERGKKEPQKKAMPKRRQLV